MGSQEKRSLARVLKLGRWIQPVKLGMACEDAARGAKGSEPGEARAETSCWKMQGGSEKFRLNKSSSVSFALPLSSSLGAVGLGGQQQGTEREA